MSEAMLDGSLPSWAVEELNRKYGMDGMPRMMQEFYADRGEIVKSVDSLSEIRTVRVRLPIGRLDVWRYRRNGTLVREVAE